mgnify:FL=1
MIKLSKRLLSIANLVNDNSKVVDIGCDHGLVSIYLAMNKQNISIIASDINQNALDNAIKNINKYHLEDKIKVCLSNGLDNINDEIDTIIISGMGGHTIIDILTNNQEKLNTVNNIIIQSNNDIEYVRRKIVKLGYCISKEELILDKNIYYTVILFTKGKKKYTNKEYYFGPILLKENSKIFIERKNKEYTKLVNIKNNIPKRKLLIRLKILKELHMYK